jgi:hypothetical protein
MGTMLCYCVTLKAMAMTSFTITLRETVNYADISASVPLEIRYIAICFNRSCAKQLEWQ